MQYSEQHPVKQNRVLPFVIPAMVLPFIASLFYYVLLAGSAIGLVIYTATKIFTVIWPIFVAFVVEDVRFKREGINWSKHFAALPLGLLTGLLIGIPIVVLFMFTPMGDYVRAHADDVTLKVTQMGIAQPMRYILFCAFLAGLHSLIEEFFWRWFIFGRLAKVCPPGLACFLAGLAFAGHHYVVLGSYFTFLGAFAFGTCVGIGGALWCWMLRRQGTLAGCWLSHALVDAAVFYVGYQLVFA